MNYTLCLNMIVKNESHIIEKTLEMLCKIFKFNYWVIADTGSTDNTKEIIIEFFRNLNIPGELLEHLWKDFGHNRTLALEAAYNKTDYLLIFDADDIIHGNLVLPELKLNIYSLIFGKNFIYTRPLLINNRLKWKFIGVLHEYLERENDSYNLKEVVKGDYYIESSRTGARNRNSSKYLEDAKILSNAYDIEDDLKLKERYAFYCAQSYKDVPDKEKSIEWYKKVIEGNNWNQEKYYACLQIANQSSDDIVKYLTLASEFDNDRIENIVELMKYYNNKKMHVLVNALYHKYKNYNKNPASKKLFLTKNYYDDMIEYYNSISAFYVNDIETGYLCCKQIISNNIISSNYLVSTLNNIIFYKDQFYKETKENKIKLINYYNQHLIKFKIKNSKFLNILQI